MKFTINSTVLVKVLDNVQGVIDKRNITPILSNVRLQVNGAKGGQLVVNATDMDLDIVEILDVNVVEEGSTTVLATTLLQIAKNLPANSTMEISLNNDQLHIKSGKFKGSLGCLPVEDFPIIKTNDLPNTFNLNKSILKQAIEKTRFAISTDEARYFLNGIYIHTTQNTAGENVLRVVATDGHKLSMFESKFENAKILEVGIIVPKKAVDELYKLLDKVEDKEVGISTSATKISFKFNNIVFTSKLIDGSFPNYIKVIPENNSNILEVPTSELSNALNLIAVFSDDKLKSIKLEIKDNKCTINAHQNLQAGEQEIDVLNKAEDIAIAFNVKYLKEIVDLVKTKNLRIKLASSNHPAIVERIEEDKSQETTDLFVIMPMRV